MRRKGKEKSGVQPKDFDEWVRNIRPEQKLNEDQDLFLKEFGKFTVVGNLLMLTLLGDIVEGDAEGGKFAFYLSPSGVTRLKTTKDGVWISDGTHRWALGYFPVPHDQRLCIIAH